MAMDNVTLAGEIQPELEKDLLELFDEMRRRALEPRDDPAKRNPMEEEEMVNRMSTIIADIVAEKVVEHIQDFAEVAVIDNAAVEAMNNAIPIPQDGGTGLKTTYLTFIASYLTANQNLGSGTIS